MSIASAATNDNPFDEKRLRADIVATWGEYGAHADLFDFMVKEIGLLRSVVFAVVRSPNEDFAELTRDQAAAVRRSCDGLAQVIQNGSEDPAS